MKKLLLSLIACLCVFTLVLTGCNEAPLDNPHGENDEVYSNGGMAVVKGDYLYFTRAYSSEANVGYNQNKYGNETLSALYRIKLDADGNIYQDEDGNKAEAQLVVKQIVGYEHSNVYIYGDYIYYTSPKTFKDDNGKNDTGYVSFNRIALNGANQKELVTYKEKLSKYSISKIGDDVVFTALTSANELKATVVNANGRVSNKTLDKDITTAILPKGEIANNSLEAYVYFTKAVNLNDDGLVDGNKVCKVSPIENKVEEIIKDGKTYNLKDIANNRLYYTDKDSILRSTDLNDDNNMYTYNELTTFFVLPNDSGDAGVVGTIKSGSYNVIVYAKAIKSGHSDIKILADGTTNSKTLTILFTTANTVVYSDGTKCYSKSILEDTAAVDLGEINFTTGGSDKYFDYDDTHIYYYAKAKDSNETYYYLYSLNYTNEDAEGEMIGAIDPTDVKEATEEAEDAEEE